MKALILRNDPDAARETSRALMDKGFQILCIETLSVAHALIRVDTVDLLVMDERVEGQLTHAIALSGERKNPYLSTILLTDRKGEDTDDLYALIPTLYALAGMETSPLIMGQLALCAVSNPAEAKARVARNVAATMMVEEAVLPPLARAPEPVLAHSDQDDEEPTCADLALADPDMAEVVARSLPEPLQRIDDVIMAEVAAVFRSHGMRDTPSAIPAPLFASETHHAVG